MKATRRKFGSIFKTKVVLEALKEQNTLQELSSKYELSVTQIKTWKQEFLSNADIIFEQKNKKVDKKNDEDKFYKKIGQLQVEIDFLKDVLDK